MPGRRGAARPALLGVGHRARPAPDGRTGGAVLVAAHGNSIRALRKHLEGISDDDITELEVPTGIPYRILLNDDLSVHASGYLGDPAAAAAAAAAVGRQAG